MRQVEPDRHWRPRPFGPKPLQYGPLLFMLNHILRLTRPGIAS